MSITVRAPKKKTKINFRDFKVYDKSVERKSFPVNKK